MPIFIVLFEKQPKNCPKKAPQKNDNFSHFAKHRLIKKPRYVATPLLTKNWCFWTWVFWNQKQWCWTTNITQNQEKRKIRKRDFKEKTRQETKKREHIHWKQRNCNFIFSCCSIHETKAKKKEQWKKRQKQENKKKGKEERQEGRKKDKRKRETEKEKQKRGRPKKVKGGRKRNTENKPKNAPCRGKNRVFSIKTKKGKEPKRKQKATKKKQINKEGLGPSEVALSGHLTWPLNPPNKKKTKKIKKIKKKNKNKTKTKKTNKEGLGPSEGPPHMTLKPSKRKTKKQQKKNKKRQNKRKKQEKTKEYSKMSFSGYQWKFSSFLAGCPKFPFFDNLAQKARHPKNTIKIGVSSKLFFGKHKCVTKRPFLDQKNLNS